MKIEKQTANDFLNDFHNTHLKNLVSATINKEIFSKLKPEEIVAEEPGPNLGNMKPAVYRVTAKIAMEREEKKAQQQKDILNAIKTIRENHLLREYE